MNEPVEWNEGPNHSLVPIGIDLEESYITDWRQTDNSVKIIMLLDVTPVSPFYETPAFGKMNCYKTGALQLEGIENHEPWPSSQEIDPTWSSRDDMHWGAVRNFALDGNRVSFSTDFGDFQLDCESFDLTVDGTRS